MKRGPYIKPPSRLPCGCRYSYDMKKRKRIQAVDVVRLEGAVICRHGKRWRPGWIADGQIR